ncbi:MAG: sporulation membrane protein YtaF [Clostridia bacterium]|nr:sporulation membrane protein YtaF [Clostridia bacterium]
MLSAVLIAVAVSLDGLVVGAAYGVHRIRLHVAGLAIIGATSTLLVAAAQAAGGRLAAWLPPEWAGRLGGLMLIAVGVTFLLQQRASRAPSDSDTRPRSTSRVIQIWRAPEAADADRSGTIDWREALVLGLALSMDAFGAGLGAAIGGWGGALLPWLVGASQITFVACGRFLGRHAFSTVAARLDVLPAVLLIAVGLARLA